MRCGESGPGRGLTAAAAAPAGCFQRASPPDRPVPPPRSGCRLATLRCPTAVAAVAVGQAGRSSSMNGDTSRSAAATRSPPAGSASMAAISGSHPYGKERDWPWQRGEPRLGVGASRQAQQYNQANKRKNKTEQQPDDCTAAAPTGKHGSHDGKEKHQAKGRPIPAYKTKSFATLPPIGLLFLTTQAESMQHIPPFSVSPHWASVN